MKLLLPYAYNSKGELVHIDNAVKGQKYTCPSCGSELLLKISKIPEGEKYHRRNHYAHKGNSENHCSESFLHKYFKEKCAEFIQSKINADENIDFEYTCDICYENHSGNLLRKAKTVAVEYDLGFCIPDIALLDDNGKVIIVIEVVVTHKPEPKVMEYYDKNNIVCIQIKIKDFYECEIIEWKLSHPYSVNRCPTPICKKCGERMESEKLIIVNTKCYNCHQEMKVAMKMSHSTTLSPEHFSEEDINIAKQCGAKIGKVYSKTRKESYNANICKHCNKFVGDHFMHDYYYSPREVEIDRGYICANCINIAHEEKVNDEFEESQKRRDEIMQITINAGQKLCPKCGARLYVRQSHRGFFWGCSAYPNCRHIENIDES